MSSSQGSFPFRERNPGSFVPPHPSDLRSSRVRGLPSSRRQVCSRLCGPELLLEEVAARGPVDPWQLCNKCRSAAISWPLARKSPRNLGFSRKSGPSRPLWAPLPGGVPLPTKNPKFRKIPDPRGALGFWGSKLFEFPVTVQKFSPRNFPRRDLTSI